MLWLSEVREARRLFRAFKARMAELVQEVTSPSCDMRSVAYQPEAAVRHHISMHVPPDCIFLHENASLQHSVHRHGCAFRPIVHRSKHPATAGDMQQNCDVR